MSENKWNELIAGLPDPHLLQTYEWGQVKACYGWQPLYLIWKRGKNYGSGGRGPACGKFRSGKLADRSAVSVEGAGRDDPESAEDFAGSAGPPG